MLRVVYHFRGSVQEGFRMVVAHADVVNEDTDVKAANGLLDARDVGFVTGREVNVDDLRTNALVL